MSQHSQLAAGSGIVPADGQHGDVFSGPACFAPSPRPPSRQVATIGIEPSSFLKRAMLWRAFGVAEVASVAADGFCDRACEADAVVVQALPDPPSWDRLLAWAGKRTVVVDIETAAAMARAAGHAVRMEIAAGSTAGSLEVMCHQENRTVYPQAPLIEITAPPPVPTGFAPGDRVHLYTPSPLDPAIRVIVPGEALEGFIRKYDFTVWGRESRTQGAALLSCPTPAGGLVTIMDLLTVDRKPEPCGSETPAVQLFLSLLGRSPVTFGRFVVPHPHYGDFVDALSDLVRKHAGYAGLERIGRSVGGRDLWLLKIARRPGLPAVTFSNAVHPYEWAPIYGVLRYVRFLLERVAAGGWEADELLGSHQLWWVPSVCPDGFDNRQQQPSAINLNRNFPGGWEYAAPGTVHWGSMGAPHSIEELCPISLRGPAGGSQPESQAMMSLLERKDGRIVALADFHENVGTNNFLHQFEDEQGTIADPFYHVELLDGIGQAFAGRFFEQRANAFYRVDHSSDFHPGAICAWLGYAVRRGAKGCVVEASGGDCTHYRTVRRTEYAAQVAEQVLADQLGRLFRNPWNAEQEVCMNLRRRPAKVRCRLYGADGGLLEETVERHPTHIVRTVPPGAALRLRFEDADR